MNLCETQKNLGLIWDVEEDGLKIHCNKNLIVPPKLSRGEELRFLAGPIDPLGYIASHLLRSKLFLHGATCLSIGLKDIVTS